MLLLSPGNVNDIAMAPALIAAAGPIKRLIADKAYDAKSLRQLLAEQGAKAVIPSTLSGCSLVSRTSAGSQPATTSSPETSWLAS